MISIANAKYLQVFFADACATSKARYENDLFDAVAGEVNDVNSISVIGRNKIMLNVD